MTRQERLLEQTAGHAAVIFGHSHKPSVESRDDVIYFNSGSAGPRRFKLPVAHLHVSADGVEPAIVQLRV